MTELLGYGKARDFEAPEGHVLIEEGRKVYCVSEDFFCDHCDGCGCKSCKWTGESSTWNN